MQKPATLRRSDMIAVIAVIELIDDDDLRGITYVNAVVAIVGESDGARHQLSDPDYRSRILDADEKLSLTKQASIRPRTNVRPISQKPLPN